MIPCKLWCEAKCNSFNLYIMLTFGKPDRETTCDLCGMCGSDQFRLQCLHECPSSDMATRRVAIRRKSKILPPGALMDLTTTKHKSSILKLKSRWRLFFGGEEIWGTLKLKMRFVERSYYIGCFFFLFFEIWGTLKLKMRFVEREYLRNLQGHSVVLWHAQTPRMWPVLELWPVPMQKRSSGWRREIWWSLEGILYGGFNL